MGCLSLLEQFFNNQSVGAFVGAFAAFMLVVLNDWRRDRRRVRSIRNEMKMNLAHAKGKLQTLRSNRAAMREHNKVMPSPIIKFNTGYIRQIAAEVLDSFSPDQRRAIDAICYTMEATDGLLEEAYTLAKTFQTALGQAERIANAESLLAEYGDGIVNLKRLIEMCENYVEERYAIIVTKQYDREAYEEH